MTLKDLAKKLGKSTSELSRILGKVGFRGIYKESHTVPSEAIPLVEATLLNSDQPTPTALPSANTDTEPSPIKETNQEQITSPSAKDSETQLSQVSQAMLETDLHLTKTRNAQIINNATAIGIREALTANMARKAGYTQTAEALADMDAKAQQAMINQLMAEISNPDFFAGKTPQESYYKASKHTADNTLINEWTAVLNNIK